jgi:cob(I)alamin adenosyltransferase
VKTYVGSGDRGKTSLLSGERVEKSHARIEAVGEVDELNSVLGALIATLPEKQGELSRELQGIQADLFHVGAWLATSPGSPTLEMLQEIGPNHTKALEAAVDRLEAALPPLRSFIFPGGHPTPPGLTSPERSAAGLNDRCSVLLPVSPPSASAP